MNANAKVQASLRPQEREMSTQFDDTDSDEFIDENSKETDEDWIDFQLF